MMIDPERANNNNLAEYATKRQMKGGNRQFDKIKIPKMKLRTSKRALCIVNVLSLLARSYL